MIETKEIGIVADDLTGACDVAACFAPAAGPIDVPLSPNFPWIARSVLRVVNTQSRLKDPQTAYRILHDVGKAMAEKRIVFKKIDTMLRGPVGAELGGLVEGLLTSANGWTCVVAPAAPSIGRTTRHGVQYDQGIPIDPGSLAAEPGGPPPCADIRTVLGQSGADNYLVCDAETQEDLQKIVDMFLHQESRLVFVGSLGLAQALAQRLNAVPPPPPSVKPAKRPMIVCGSCHHQSFRQTQQAQTDGIQILDFDPARGCFRQSISSNGKSTVLARILPSPLTGAGYSPCLITASFLNALVPLWEQVKPDGLGVIGGETAYHLLHGLGGKRLEVYRRRAEVMACTRMIGGVMNGCRLICKGGSVGPDDAVLQMLSLLTSANYGGNR